MMEYFEHITARSLGTGVVMWIRYIMDISDSIVDTCS